MSRRSPVRLRTAFQAAVTAHAAVVGESRVSVEMAAKKAVRHADSVG